jgi:tetratricopeptide (TPR) repeat protein
MVSEAGNTTRETQGGAHAQPVTGLTGGGGASAARAPSAVVDGLLRRARTLHERGALDDAERGYREVLQADADHADALHLLGVLHFQRGRMEEADAAISRSLERMPSALALANHASVLAGLGRRDDALAQLDAALAMSPAHPRSLVLRASLLAELTRYDEALQTYERLLEVAPKVADVWCSRAAVLRALQRNQEALESSERALKIDNRSFNAHTQRGHALRALGRLVDALDSYGRALTIVPNSGEVLLMQALTLADQGRLDAALSSLNEAIAGQPDFVDAIYNSAVVLERLGRFDDALARCDRVLALNARHAAALANKGNVLHGMQRHAEAVESFDASLEIEPASLEVLCNRAQALLNLRRHLEALDSCDRAIALDAAYAQAWYCRGVVLRRLHRNEDALASLDRVLVLQPDHKLSLYLRGNTLRSLMRHDEALAGFDRVLALDPDDAVAHFARAFVYLQLGDFTRGWPEYEWRWREAQVGIYKRSFVQPLWLGVEPLEGKTILLHAEQGLGDTLQFCRYAKLVKARGARVIVEVPVPMKSLMAGVEGIDQVVAYGEPLPPFDVQTPLLSLPLAFRTDHATMPVDVPYVQASHERMERWQARLGARTRPRIGIVWSGNPDHPDDHNRSIPLETLLPALAGSVEWVSVQKFVRAEEQALLERSSVRHFGDELADLSDTAALVQCLDGVVSVDTSAAHLAGALGRPLWLMLPYLPDWRWQLDREDCPWYPSARLFRQTRAGEWGDVFERIGASMQAVAATAAAADLLT